MAGNGIRIEGFDFEDIERYIKEEEITEIEQSRALKKAVKVASEEVKKVLPKRTGKAKRSVKQKSSKQDFGAEETLYIDDWKWMFQEFRNTRQKGKYVGTFERAINKVNDKVIATLRKELFKK